jgi:predicted N-acetyltransferase YhbS
MNFLSICDQDKEHILQLAFTLFCKEDQPAIRKSLRTCLNSLSRIYKDADTIAAFALVTAGVCTQQLKEDPNVATIAFCGVSPILQGKGIGSKLLKETISGIFQSGFTTCQLIVDGWNDAAKRLYERFGFIEVAPLREDHTIGFVMQLERRKWLEDEALMAAAAARAKKLMQAAANPLCHPSFSLISPTTCISVNSL